MNDKLTLEEIDKFFKTILNLDAEDYKNKNSQDDDEGSMSPNKIKRNSK